MLAVTPKRYYSYAYTVILFQSNRFLLYLFLLCAQKNVWIALIYRFDFDRIHNIFFLSFFFCSLFYFSPVKQYCWVCSACAIQIRLYLCSFIRITNPLWVITETAMTQSLYFFFVHCTVYLICRAAFIQLA